MEDNKKIHHSTPYFDVVQSGSMHGIEPYDVCVVVMPFERDASGLPRNIGVLKEYNPMRRDNYSMTLVTGRTEDEDPDLLTTAMRELKEESGYDVSDPDRWCFLGFLTTSKLVDQEHPCFAVDITGIEPGEKEGDGTEAESKSEFKIVTVKQALDTDDCYIPALFMKMFKFIFNVNDFTQAGNDEIDVDEIKQKLDQTVLKIEGVNGSLVIDVDGIPTIEYTVQAMTDEIKQAIPEEFEGVKITTKVLDGTGETTGSDGDTTGVQPGEESGDTEGSAEDAGSGE